MVICCYYNPKKSDIRAHLEQFDKSLALYLLNYEYFVVLGDFNVYVQDNVRVL